MFRLRSDSLSLCRWTLKRPEDHLRRGRSVRGLKIGQRLRMPSPLIEIYVIHCSCLNTEQQRNRAPDNDVLAGDSNEVNSALTVNNLSLPATPPESS